MNSVLLALLAAALVWIQCWIGGTRLVFSLPPYLVLALASLLTIPLLRRRLAAPNAACLATAAVWFGYTLARAALSPVDYLWWPDFFMVLGCLMAYLLVANYLTRSKERAWLLAILLALAVAQILIAFRQFSQGDDFMAFGFVRPEMGRRASGLFVGSISLAGCLETMGILALSLAFWSRWPGWARLLTGYLAAMCYAGVGVTGSRGGYLSSLFSLAVFWALSIWTAKRLALPHHRVIALGSAATLALAPIAGVALMQQSPMLQSRLNLLVDQFTNGHPDMRIHNWAAALDQFQRSPIIGTGAGTHLYYGRLFRRPQLQADPEHAHSDYLELLAEYGIIGALGMIAFVFAHVRNAFHSITRLVALEQEEPGRSRSLALALQLGALGVAAAYLAHSAVDFNLHIPGDALLVAVVFGFMANPGGECARTAEKSSAGIIRFALPALGLWMCLAGVPKIRGEFLAEKARVALRNHAYLEAISLGGEAAKAEPRNPWIYFTVGEANRVFSGGLIRTLRRPYLEAAVDAYQEGLKIFPTDENLWVRLGQALDGLQRFHEADAAYRQAIAADPNLGILHALYALHLQTCGRSDESQDEMTAGENLAGIALAKQLQADPGRFFAH